MKPWNDWLVSVESLTVINFRCIVHEKTKFLTITFVMLRWSIPKVTVEMNSWNDWLVLLNCSQSQFFCGFFKLSLTSNSLSQWPLLCLEGQFPNLNLSNFSDEIYVRLVQNLIILFSVYAHDGAGLLRNHSLPMCFLQR